MKKTIENFIPQGGKHCITNSLNQSFSPMVNGRTKVFEFEEKLANRLNISIQCKSGSDYENKQFLISDRDNHDFPIRTPFGNIAEDFHYVSYQEMEQARSSIHRPFPAKNKYLLFDFSGYKQINKSVLYEAINETCSSMPNPPAKLLGVNGILKFSKEILKWEKFSTGKLKISGTTNYFQISKDGGTGGGIFRKMYGDFLIEVAPILENENISQVGRYHAITYNV